QTAGKKDNGNGEINGKRQGNAHPYGGRACGLCGVFRIRDKKRTVHIGGSDGAVSFRTGYVGTFCICGASGGAGGDTDHAGRNFLSGRSSAVWTGLGISI